MLNALKTSPQVHFSDEVEEPGTGKIIKYKKPLLVLFFVLLMVAVFSLRSNPDEETALSKKSLEKPRTPPAVEQKTKPVPAPSKTERTEQNSASEPVLTEKAPGKQALPSLKDDEKEFAFQNDKEYLAMNRFERPQSETIGPVFGGQNVQDTVTVGDRSLVLAGRGFEIREFQSNSKETLHADFLRHLKRPLPKMDRVPEDHLDLRLSRVKSSKHLIFHPLGPALSPLPNRPHEEDPEPQKKPQDLENIPETKLLFNESEKSDLLLRPGSESLDLLIGNEKINRKRYGSW